MASIETAWSNYIHCGESVASYNNVENNVENIVRDILNKEYDVKKKEPVKQPKHFQILRRNIGLFKFYNPDNDEFVGVNLKKVIFNPPATIVLWSDGTRTVVKCRDGEIFDQHTGLAMCVVKKLYGDDFHYILNKFAGKCEDEKKAEKFEDAFEMAHKRAEEELRESIKAIIKKELEPYNGRHLDE